MPNEHFLIRVHDTQVIREKMILKAIQWKNKGKAINKGGIEGIALRDVIALTQLQDELAALIEEYETAVNDLDKEKQ